MSITSRTTHDGPTSLSVGPFSAALFDLDGTLVDTAPDLVNALFRVCDEHSIARPERALATQHVSLGGLGLVQLAMPAASGDTQRQAHLDLLDTYSAHIADASAFYPAWRETLPQIDVPWGVVTNKPHALAVTLMQQLGAPVPDCIVGGDLLTRRKPEPDPLIFAAGLLGVRPQDCLYFGDHERDMVAAKSCGMHAVGVTYGYLLDDDDPTTWPADELARDDAAAAQILLSALAQTDVAHA
ncbi:MAG: HAD-IA family hydrolase [Pseudomonadota bacterium]